MSSQQQSAPALVRQVDDRLDDAGIRLTSGRRSVVAALASVSGPRSAGEIHDTLDRSVPLSSIYRTLAVFERTGVVTPHHGTRGVTRYELAEWLTGHHHHLVCGTCGTVEDLDLDPRRETTLQRLVHEIGSDSGFSVTGHSLEIEGTCDECAA